MPKKFKGENSKAVEARLRKAAVAAAEKERKQQAEEDEFWHDDDKLVAKKQQRKDDKEKKRSQQLERKKELQLLHDEEMSHMKSAKPVSEKINRADIQLNLSSQGAVTKPSNDDADVPIPENVNRLITEGDEARTVEEALSVLSMKEDSIDKHPEKRVKAAYIAYEERCLPILKQENPNMRLSQLKQILKKDWMKSPENPLNQRHLAYNAKKS